MSLIDDMLAAEGRTVSAPQRAALATAVAAASEEDEATMLYLRMLATLAAAWPGWAAPPSAPLPTSVPSLIHNIFDGLEEVRLPLAHSPEAHLPPLSPPSSQPMSTRASPWTWVCLKRHPKPSLQGNC